MLPTRCHEINGSRPPSLRVGKLSHTIGKTTSNAVRNQPRQLKEPVIIYAHSPKVIHTRAEDFMALVQRLTGRLTEIRRDSNDVSESTSSALTEEVNSVNSGCDEDNTTTFSPEKKAIEDRQQHIADVPLFTPSSMVLFGSPNSVYMRFEPGLVLSPNRTDLVSPSVFNFMKEFP